MGKRLLSVPIALALLMAVPTGTLAQSLKQKALNDQITGRAELKEKALSVSGIKGFKVKSHKTVSTKFQTAEVHPTLAQELTFGQRRLAASSDASDLHPLYGNVIWSNAWATDNKAHYGIYSFLPKQNMTVDSVYESSIFNAVSGMMYDDKVHFVYTMKFMGMVYGVYFYEYDTNTWKYTKAVKAPDATYQAYAMAHDDNNDTDYGFFPTTDGIELAELDLSGSTASKSRIGLTGKLAFNTLAIDNQSNAYAIDTLGDFYKVGLTNGSLTKVGATGVKPETYHASLTYDSYDGQLYWATWVKDGGNGYSALFTIDRTTGKATLVSNLPHNEEISYMYVKEPLASAEAPAVASGLSVDFPNGSNSGTISFTAPSKTYNGNDLSGELDYFVKVSGDTVATGKATAGSKVTVNANAATGRKLFVVTTSNAAGVSPELKLKKYIGPDVPSAISSVTLKVDTVSRQATVNWTAPTTGINNGYIDKENLQYTVVRQPADDTVATGLKALTYSETLPDTSLTPYYYDVIPVNAGLAGAASHSNTVAIGGPYSTPYYEPFDTKDYFDLYTVIDGNNDKRTWSYDAASQSAKYTYSADNDADDWLITPEIRLKADRFYKLSFASRPHLGDEYTKIYPEIVSVSFGSGTDTAAYKQIVEPTTVKSDTTIEVSFKAPSDGVYHIAFKAQSHKNSYHLFVDDVKLVDGAMRNAPDSVTSLRVISGAKGSRKATVTFKAPVKNADKDDLSGNISKIDVYRIGEKDSTFVGSVSNVNAGSAQQVVDNSPVANARNTYLVIPYNTVGIGTPATASAFIGFDTPLPPSDAVIKDSHNGNINVTWNKPDTIGVNGGYVDVDKLITVVASVSTSSGRIDRILYQSTGSSTSYKTPTPAAQRIELLALCSYVNDTTFSSFVTTNPLIVGNSYKVPFEEGFPKGQFQHPMWWVERGFTDTTAPNITDTDDGDGDGGSAYWEAQHDGDQAWLNSGKISLAGAEHPVLVYRYYAESGRNASITTEVSTGANDETPADSVVYSKLSGNSGWRFAKVDLAAYKSAPYVVLKFHCKSNPDTRISIDDIRIYDQKAFDVRTELNAPDTVRVSNTADIKVRVINKGRSLADNYTVTLYADGKVIGTETGRPLAALNEHVYTFGYTAKQSDPASVKLTAKVDYKADQDTIDNTTTAKNIQVKKNDYQTVTITGTESSDSLILSWTEPVITGNTKTDDMESYEWPDIANVGPWTFVDGDKQVNVNFRDQGLYIRNDSKPYAFMVFNPEALNFDTKSQPQIKPHSGAQVLMSMKPQSDKAAKSDWLISPELGGHSQTISFYAKSVSSELPDHMEILYSTSNNDTINFEPLDSTTVPGGNEWTEYSYQLPEGSQYFAVHVNTAAGKGYMFFIDDITYTTGFLTLDHYNIYRNGELYGTADMEATEYKVPRDGASYTVTAVYTAGESDFSNAVSSTVDAIKSIEVSASNPKDIYSVDGKLVRRNATTSAGLQHGVYVVNGVKFVVK